MIWVTREERLWYLRNVAQGLVEYLGVTDPPVPVEEMLRHPPQVYNEDFGVVDMYSNLWDATFARPPSQKGSIFVRIDLPPDERRYALARETLSALITSKHGRSLGLAEMLMPSLGESSDYFARHFTAPQPLVDTYRTRGGDERNFAPTFRIPAQVAAQRWAEL